MSLWKKLLPYALRHEVKHRGYDPIEVATFLKSDGISQEERSEIAGILKDYGLEFEDLPEDSDGHVLKIGESQKTKKQKKQIRESLEEGTKTSKKIAKELKLSPQRVSNLLKNIEGAKNPMGTRWELEK